MYDAYHMVGLDVMPTTGGNDELNGKPLNNCWIYHKDFAQGGVLELWLGPELDKAWGAYHPNR